MPPEDCVSVARYHRAAVRLRCDGRSARRLFVIETYRTVPADVANMSRTGIGLRLGEPIHPGAYVFVELEGDMIAELFAKVVHATQRGDTWLIGCEFMTPLTGSELRCFMSLPAELPAATSPAVPSPAAASPVGALPATDLADSPPASSPALSPAAHE